MGAHPAQAHLGERPSQDGRHLLRDHAAVVGTGAFQCVAFKKGDYVEMVANKHYFGGRAPHRHDRVQDYQSADTMTNDFRRAPSTPRRTCRRRSSTVARTKGLTAIAYNYRNWDYLGMNCDTSSASLGNPVLKDVRFRQALNRAIDREQAGRRRLVRPRAARHDDPAAGRVVRPRLPLAAAGRRAVHLRPRQGRAGPRPGRLHRTNGDGVRDHHGKPIELRLYADSASTRNRPRPSSSPLSCRELGLKIKLEVSARAC